MSRPHPSPYRVEIVWSANLGKFMAAAPELPGCIASADTRMIALADLEDRMAEWMALARETGRAIPKAAGAK
jgi:predicted RNase H-like HicB family nuclease